VKDTVLLEELSWPDVQEMLESGVRTGAVISGGRPVLVVERRRGFGLVLGGHV
jgi:hypothetical protein